ncbi:DUF2070 family protein [Oxyplasma meridianum]|uniref:DUF2070 family protein n=1 Tax=Oxyplasma meridianum TaxID=3073602 RepID=A0AAX4NFQ9_9ARCH
MDERGEHRKFSDLAKYVRKSPPWWAYILPILALLTVDYFLIGSLYVVIFGILGSYLLVIALDSLFFVITRFSFPFRRIIFLDFTSLLIWNLFFWVIYFLHVFQSYEIAIMISISSTALLRILIFFIYYSDNIIKSTIPALNYTFSSIVALTVIFRDYYVLVPFILSSIVYVIAGFIFIKSTTKGFAREYGESPTKLIKFFLNYQNESSENKIGERFFKRMYRSKRTVPVKVIDIRRSNGTRKVLLVFPYIHPGPFGTLGSSDLPARLQSRLNDLGSDLMVFHTTTTNSNNCSGESDIDSISNAVRRSLDHMEYVTTMSRFKKLSVGKIAIGILKFGDFGIGSIIPEKISFDDVSLKEGLKLIHSVEKSTLKNFAPIDAQNYFHERAPELHDCSTLSNAFIREFSKLPSKYPAKIGYGHVAPSMPDLASVGIQALVFDTGDKLNTIVLTDSNNITREAIKACEEKLKELVSSVEIYTTDNHYVNAGTLNINPLGIAGNLSEISDYVYAAVNKAIQNTEEVSVGMATEEAQVRMGDENAFQKLIGSVFASLKTAKYSIIITISSSVALSVLMFRFLVTFV